MTTPRSLRVVQVSDSHLAPGLDSAEDNWTAVVEHLRTDPPDLVVHTGDISLDGAHDDTHLDHARARLDELPCPWKAIPGNHDIGDMAPTNMPLRAERRAAYEERFGDADWAVDLDGWRLVGVDIQTLVAGDDAEDRWAWLETALTPDRPTMLCCHRPLRPPPSDDENPSRYVPQPARSRLTSLLASAGARIVATGHVHQRGVFEQDHLRAEWAPATWGYLPDSIQHLIGEKCVGILEHELGDEAVSRLVVPAAMRGAVIGEDYPNPYEALEPTWVRDR